MPNLAAEWSRLRSTPRANRSNIDPCFFVDVDSLEPIEFNFFTAGSRPGRVWAQLNPLPTSFGFRVPKRIGFFPRLMTRSRAVEFAEMGELFGAVFPIPENPSGRCAVLAVKQLDRR